jgi:cytochrome c
LPDFLGTTKQNGKIIPNDHKIYQMAIKYTKWMKNRPNGDKIYQRLPLQDSPKLTQIGIFGLKIYHLATLCWSP